MPKLARIIATLIAVSFLAWGLAPGAQAATHTSNKVVVVIIENHGIDQVRKSMPKTYAYGTKYALGTNMSAISRPSKPNYLALVSGSTQGEAGTNRVATESAPDIMSQTYLDKKGRTARTFADGMTTRCSRTGQGSYAPRHNPSVMFVSTKEKQAYCTANDLEGKHWTKAVTKGYLANVNLLVPSNDHNWHDGSAKQADDYISARAAEFVAGPDFAAGATMVITADEPVKSASTSAPIPLIVIQRDLSHATVSTKLSLYSLGAFMAEHGHTAALGAQKAESGKFARAFGITAR